VALLFGWRQRADESLRRFTVLYYELGRKGAKSTLMAGIGLFHLTREQEPGASVVCGATTGSQARIVFSIMQRMVRQSKWLRHEGVQALANSIITEDGNVKPINAKASTQDGLNPSCIILDESHAQNFGLHDVLRSAQGGRENPLLLAPTTAGYDLLSVGYALRTTVIKLLQGVFEADHFLGLIYTLDDGDDWRDERVWVKSNPMLGITPKLTWVRQYCADAQQTQGLEGEFRVKVCSQWLQSASSWLSMTQWDECADVTLKLEDFAGKPCWIGGDLAQLDDIAAVALIFERGADLCALVRFYLPRAVVEERARVVPEYRLWVNAGLLVLTDGSMIDYDFIEQDIRTWCRQFSVQAIWLDQYGSATLVSRLEADSFPAAILDKNAKNFTPPARELETRLRHRRFKHDGNSCLKWMASNTVVRRGVDDTILPKKELANSPNKIDGIDAILQAIAAKLRPQAAAPEFQMLVLGGAR
jgi:phage terminase large subunit-like protein